MLEKLHAQSETLYLEVTEGGEGVKRNMHSPQHMVDITVGAAYLFIGVRLSASHPGNLMPTDLYSSFVEDMTEWDSCAEEHVNCAR